MLSAIGYTDPQRQLRNPETGMVIIGEWIGIYCKRDIDGKIL